MFAAVVCLIGQLAISLATAPSPSQVRDLDGRSWTPLSPAPGNVNVLFFISTDCPISNRYAPEIDRMAAAYRDKHVQMFLIYVEPAAAIERVRTHVGEFHAGVRAPAIVDAGLDVTRAADATVTPEAIVMTTSGRAYRGRIDDLYVNLGQTRRAPQHHDLRDALDALLKGAPVHQKETQAIGCFIDRGEK